MKLYYLGNTTASVVTLATIILAGTLLNLGRGQASDRTSDDGSDFRISRGFEIAPVPLNLHGKDRALVGLGSYIMNAASDCNSCHTLNPAAEFVAGANPYLLGQQQPAKLNPGVYLGGGNDFGTLDPDGRSAHIISRNLTPDKTGRPEGGATFEEFLDHIRNGNDTDHWHPTCMDNKLGPNCVPFPFNGEKARRLRPRSGGPHSGHSFTSSVVIFLLIYSAPCDAFSFVRLGIVADALVLIMCSGLWFQRIQSWLIWTKGIESTSSST